MLYNCCIKKHCHVLPCVQRQALKFFKGQPPANTLQVDLCCLLNVFKDIVTIRVCFEKWVSWFNPN